MPFEAQLRVARDQGGNGVELSDEPAAWDTYETAALAEEHNETARRMFLDDLFLTLSLGRPAEEGRDFSLHVIEVDETSARGRGSIERNKEGE